MDWSDARLFLAVARHGQMLAAARSLGLNQATLSRRMTALEKSVGTKLLVRRTTGCDLTEMGRAFLQKLEPAEAAFLASQAMFGARDEGIAGSVRIGTPDGFGSLFLAPRLGELNARYPELAIQLVPVARSFSLSQREADIAVMIGRPMQGRLVTRKLTDYSLSLYAARDYLTRNGTPVSAQDLTKHTLIGYVEDLLYAPSLDFAHEFSPNWRSSIEVSTAVGQMEAIEGGAGIGVAHDFLAPRYANLELVLPKRQVTRSYWTVVHENLRDLPRINAVTQFLAEIVADARGGFLRKPA